MRVVRGLIAAALAVAFALVGSEMASFAQTPTQLKVGDPAPAFSLPGSDGKTYQLSDFRGKQAVVLVWFVKAFSAG